MPLQLIIMLTATSASDYEEVVLLLNSRTWPQKNTPKMEKNLDNV
jgi:hypothetical protein